MNVFKTSWYSHRIGRDMPVKVYGHYGFPLLMFPTAAADFEEYERFYLVEMIRPWIEKGLVKCYSIDSVNSWTWMNSRIHSSERARRHEAYDQYVMQEVVPFIWLNQGNRDGIFTTGASMGAYHALNFLLRHPQVFGGTVAMSGAYDLSPWTGGYMDELIYMNSPRHYMPNLNDHGYLEMLRYRGKGIHILTGQGSYEAPHQSKEISDILWSKGIWHNLEMWGHDMPHDWPTWRRMLPAFMPHQTGWAG